MLLTAVAFSKIEEEQYLEFVTISTEIMVVGNLRVEDRKKHQYFSSIAVKITAAIFPV